ncbi:hypothetical protein FV232_26070 [Methylobacterium sp. WL30]|uniref:hypothetical protein n=1 Tax=unclassified Methylobacterium TaxID=2615210 RepID=UPI0011C7BA9D|nr:MULTISPECIES: hypothetical protein [unclassified Methylobacterium]TXM94032.1 hypothetical protein FV223_06230 [Methylobacterium sp. WL116]TXN39582.1 hypothetical protein FV225_09260 [Methylobacterium sp. WL93]TXN45544.1 hypothetical protein FV227_24890 [Methylobacterium sp. WL119]TXN62105.1 hypothetical protein FV232_26070 [Methylobacterium sp. WL30]
MTDETAALILALATENAELRAALAEAQELLVETAVDAGEMHAHVEELQAELTKMLVERSCNGGKNAVWINLTGS